MRLVVTIGGYKLLFSPDANVGAITEGLGGASNIRERGPYNAKVFEIYQDGPEIEIALVSEQKIRGISTESEIIDRLLEVEERRSKASSDAYQKGEDLRKATSRISELEGLLVEATEKIGRLTLAAVDQLPGAQDTICAAAALGLNVAISLPERPPEISDGSEEDSVQEAIDQGLPAYEIDSRIDRDAGF
jgi:hypothetical protein